MHRGYGASAGSTGVARRAFSFPARWLGPIALALARSPIDECVDEHVSVAVVELHFAQIFHRWKRALGRLFPPDQLGRGEVRDESRLNVPDRVAEPVTARSQGRPVGNPSFTRVDTLAMSESGISAPRA